ncbi:MAG TPA: QueT transporter family protein [Bacillota bacterium]|nr:QueT transporter family protein [Bacillota bacterium]
MKARRIAVTGMIAGLYAALTYALGAVAYLPHQIRFAEALAVLPYLTPLAIPGLTLGTFLANLGSPLGWIDWVFGTLATLVAAILTRHAPHRLLAPLPPVVVNAVVVGYYLAAILDLPFAATAGQVFLGQMVACYVIGYPLLTFLAGRPSLVRRLRGQT